MRTKTTPLIAAAAIIAGSVTSVSGAVVSFSNQDISIPPTSAGVSVDLETASVSDALAGGLGADMNFVLGGAGLSNDADQSVFAPTWQPVRSGTANTDPVQDLEIGTIVGPASITSSGFGGSSNHFPPFVSAMRGYIGFSVVLDDSTLAYGWVEVTLQDDNTPGVIHGWAFEDSGAPISVGVPEPSHTLMVVLGLFASVVRRRRR